MEVVEEVAVEEEDEDESDELDEVEEGVESLLLSSKTSSFS